MLVLLAIVCHFKLTLDPPASEESVWYVHCTHISTNRSCGNSAIYPLAMVIRRIDSFNSISIFFWKGNSIQKFWIIFNLNWIENDNIIALSIHFKNLSIFYHFYFNIIFESTKSNCCCWLGWVKYCFKYCSPQSNSNQLLGEREFKSSF